jgi:hypothetical protein
MIGRRRIGGAAAALAALLGTACADRAPGQDRSAVPRNPAALTEREAYRPRIDPADFVRTIDNPYLPLRPGTTRVYEGVSEGEREVTEVTTTNRTKEVMGVTTTVVRDRVFVGGELVEDTFDWYAQDRFGNVWYFGEASRDYEGGEVVSTKGSWEAGVDGAQPGVVMLGDPAVGDAYRQEFYQGEAEDTARVLALRESVAVPYGSYPDVVVTEDRNPLEPKILEHKFYARGVGVVLERLVEGGHEVLRLVDVRGD